MCLSEAADYLLQEVYLEPKDHLLLVKVEVEVEVDTDDSFSSPVRNQLQSQSATSRTSGTSGREVSTCSIIDLLSNSGASRSSDTPLGSLWQVEEEDEEEEEVSFDGTHYTSDSSFGSSGSPGKAHPQLIGTLVAFDKPKRTTVSTTMPSKKASSQDCIATFVWRYVCIWNALCQTKAHTPSEGLRPTVSPDAPGAPMKRKRNLSDEEREAVIHHLLAHLLRPDGKLDRDSTISVGAKFNVCPRTVKRIWKQFFSTMDDNCVGEGM